MNIRSALHITTALDARMTSISRELIDATSHGQEADPTRLALLGRLVSKAQGTARRVATALDTQADADPTNRLDAAAVQSRELSNTLGGTFYRGESTQHRNPVYLLETTITAHGDARELIRSLQKATDGAVQ